MKATSKTFRESATRKAISIESSRSSSGGRWLGYTAQRYGCLYNVKTNMSMSLSYTLPLHVVATLYSVCISVLYTDRGSNSGVEKREGGGGGGGASAFPTPHPTPNTTLCTACLWYVPKGGGGGGGGGTYCVTWQLNVFQSIAAGGGGGGGGELIVWSF